MFMAFNYTDARDVYGTTKRLKFLIKIAMYRRHSSSRSFHRSRPSCKSVLIRRRLFRHSLGKSVYLASVHLNIPWRDEHSKGSVISIVGFTRLDLFITVTYPPHIVWYHYSTNIVVKSFPENLRTDSSDASIFGAKLSGPDYPLQEKTGHFRFYNIS
jgi:hypothetical protein